MASAQGSTELTTEALIKELRSKSITDEARRQAAQQLRDMVAAVQRESSAEQFQAYWSSVQAKISSLLQSDSTLDKLGSIYALDAFVDFDGVDSTVKYTRFASALTRVMSGKDINCMQPAAIVIGKLCRPGGGSLVSSLVDTEVQLALEFLQDGSTEERRYSAALLLREVARNAPTLMFGKSKDVLEWIWVGLRDQRHLIRSTSAEATKAMFNIVAARDNALKDEVMTKMYKEAVANIHHSSTESAHGSLLVLKELLEQGGMFMHAHYDEACEVVSRFKDSRDPGLRRTAVMLIPDLATYAPVQFSQEHLHHFMIYLSAMLKREKERNDAFIAIGSIANAVKSALAPYLDGILIYIREGLSVNGRKKSPVEPVFDCISRLALAVGQTLTKYMEALLDPIFACEISPKLTQALIDIAFYVPAVRPAIQERLLNMISLVLCGEPYKHMGAPAHQQAVLSAPTTASLPKDPAKDPAALETHKAEVKLALSTLGCFTFTGHVLNEFVRDVAMRYVDDDDPETREAAAITSCQLFIRDPIVNQKSFHSMQVVGDVIDRLLTVAVSDPVPRIRLRVLDILNNQFISFMSKADNIRTVFYALNDEYFPIREAAVRLIGNLTRENPAYTIPSLRKTLIQLLTELEFSDAVRNKEESAKLISLLVQNARMLIEPYVHPMMEVLLPKAADPTPAVAATIIQAIGEICTVGCEDMLQYGDRLMPVLVDALQDQSSLTKREAALRTMGQLASNSGYVIDPYLDYPQLLDLLQNIIRGEAQHATLRQETIKLMGILGALDPYKHQQAEERIPETQRRVESTQTTDISLMMTGLTPSSKEYYPTVVINALLGILKDPSLVQYHQDVISAIMSIFRTLGMECVPFLDRIIPAFLQVIRSSSPTKAEAYFSQLAALVSIVRQHIRNYLPLLVEIMQEYWNSSPSLHTTILSLVESIARTLEGEFKIYLAGLLPLMLNLLENDATMRRGPSEKVLHAFLVFGASSEEYMHLIVPVIVRTFEKASNPMFLRRMAIETIGKMSRQINVNDFASKIIHPLNRTLASGEAALRTAALDTLCALIHQLGKDYLHFMPMVSKTLHQHNLQHANYELLTAKLQKGEVLPQDLSSESRFADQLDDVTFAEQPVKKLESNPIHLRTAWATTGKSTKEDWQEWMRGFSTTLLNESPNHALRACAALANVYPPLARELFNSAFVSCWSELYDNYQDELTISLESAIKSEHIPPDLLGLLLNLAEFMEHDDKALPIDIRALGREAGRCHAYAKALHYKELEFLQEQSSPTVEALISINNQLQQTDAAIGILRKAQLYEDGIHVRETWFEKLERWDEALNFYEQREREQADDSMPKIEIVMGKMRCLHALGQWDALATIAANTWANSSHSVRRLISPLATAAAWGLNKWELMDTYLQSMRRHSTDRAFFGAIISLHRNQFAVAREYIESARQGLDVELSTLVTESYTRAYPVIVRVQMLAELEELIVYKQGEEPKRASLRKTWERRLLGCQRSPEVWQRMLRLRSLVVSPMQNMKMWIKFANLCRKSQRMGMAETSLQYLIGNEEPLENSVPYWMDPEKQRERDARRERELVSRRSVSASVSASVNSIANTNLNTTTAKNARPARSGRPLFPGSKSHGIDGANSENLLGSSGTPKPRNPLDTLPEYDDQRGLRPPPSQVIYAVLKYQWARGQAAGRASGIADKSLDCLQRFTRDLAAVVEGVQQQYKLDNAATVGGPMTALPSAGGNGLSNGLSNGLPTMNPAAAESQALLLDQTILLAKCYLRTGDWIVALNKHTWRETHVREVLTNYRHATQHNPKWYKAWHAWALANFEVVQALSAASVNGTGFNAGASLYASGMRVDGGVTTTSGTTTTQVDYSMILEHVVPAVEGFFESIALSKGSTLQDTLRLLALWLTHGGNADVNAAVVEGFTRVNVDTWLEVLPQLIARIIQPNKRVQQTVHSLLADVGRAHPQALVYPLTVAIKSWENTKRSRSAAQIMDSMRQHSAKLVEQADLVSAELIRVAVVWHELWHEGLEEASRLFFGDHNISGMFAVLMPLHRMLDAGPVTLRETSFAQAFGRDLTEAYDWCKQYEVTHDVADLNQAWDVYYQAFRRITRQIPQITSLELEYCSPLLLGAHDLDLSVPGKYRSGHPVVRIKSFENTFVVISSKQRPRKFSINGSDGHTHTFLLKGHEDIRQDERVMQLFGLCNTLLSMDAEAHKRHLNIERYPAIPLSQNSGLLGWVPNSDTLHVLIREYRDCRKILLNIEHRIMLQMAPDYDNLTLLQKVEVFGYALDNTTGQDLYRVLWLKSKNSEAWLARRTNYTRSLAVMSMVGYILGLGDRHPSNLMLDRNTGKIIHIDFGDCFEVAMKREKFPERVPFRLTRMLTYAMEVSNIEGSYRITCEHSMRVLRENKDSVMAVLEAFIHDPLLNWRLTNTQSPNTPLFNPDRELAVGRRTSVLEGGVVPKMSADGADADADGIVSIVGGPPGARARARTNSSIVGDASVATIVNGSASGGGTVRGRGPDEPTAEQVDLQNARAVEVLSRVQLKLAGRDFNPEEELDNEAHVSKLIGEATMLENLCQHYIGWCSFW